MSKIYDKYLELKRKNKDKLYLFQSGKFYIFIAEDADTINNYLVLKKTKFTNEVLKCGFPCTSLNDYMRVFNNHHLDVEIIESKDIEIQKESDQEINLIKDILKDIDINKITPIESLVILNQIMRCINGEK